MAFTKQYSLLILRRGNDVLLGYKKRGFGKGKWNGFGGKKEENETVIDAAVREMKEESGLDVEPGNIKKIGVLKFTFENNPLIMDVHIFTGFQFTGNLIESEEMKPQWFKIEDIPFKSMWEDDRVWYPLMFEGKKFRGHFNFCGDKIDSYDIKCVDSL